MGNIWLYVITKYIYEYAIGEFLEEKLKDLIPFPKDILIQQAFNYFISFIFSIFLLFYDKKQKKKKNNNKSVPSYNKIELIQNDLLEDKYLSISEIFIIVPIFISIQLSKMFIIFGFKGLNYWAVEILFMALINSKLFDLPIYKHKQLGIIIIIFFVLYLIYYIYIKEDYPKIYLSIPILIPCAIIFYLLIILLILYNLLETLLCFIASIIPHFNSCIEINENDEDNLFSIACE